ncbi:hypothetical protein ACWDA9_20055 [Streptomyces sp. NPDC001193]
MVLPTHSRRGLGDRAQLRQLLLVDLAQVCEEGDGDRDQDQRDDLEGVVQVGGGGPHHGDRRLGRDRHRADEPRHPGPGEGGGEGRGRDQERTQVDIGRSQDVHHRDDRDEREGNRQQGQARFADVAMARMRRPVVHDS